MMKHKGYIGRVWFDDEAGLFHGEVAGIRDVVTFQGTTVAGLRRAFHESVDDYLDLCRDRGGGPEKPFSGNFLVRLPPELHHQIALQARLTGESLNAWVVATLETAVKGWDRDVLPRPQRMIACEKKRRYRKSSGVKP